jgi:hypothetical protein
MNIEHRTQNVESAFAKAPADKRRTASHESRATRDGFSLMEVLLAVGTLAVGMLFIAGVFPVSIHLTTVATERTIAATVADEAFAKIKLYGFLPATDVNWVTAAAGQTPFEYVALTQPPMDYFAYPSTPTDDPNSKKYWWSAICRRIDINDVQVTVFVSRKAGASKFNALSLLSPFTFTTADRPVAVPVEVTGTAGDYELTITENVGNKTWINDGYTIVDGALGQIYRVLERYRDDPATPLIDESQIIRLDKSWQGGTLPGYVWVVPPPVGGGRYPCIAVYQKVINF